jgi:hypothetical protein
VKVKFWVTDYRRQDIENFLKEKGIAYSTWSMFHAYELEEEDAILLKIQFPMLWRVTL